MQRASGWTEQGGVSVVISGTPGSDTQTFQQSFAGATATVYDAGTVNASTIYDDNLASPTAKANPFTVNSTTGFWYFYAANGRYDITFSGGDIDTPFTVSDLLLRDNQEVIPALADEATPTVADGHLFLTGGTTTITDFDDGREGQIIVIIAEHAITITDGTNIFLAGSANYAMAATDTLTLVCKADNLWYELARSVNSA